METFETVHRLLTSASAEISNIDAPRSHRSHRALTLQAIKAALSALSTWEIIERAHSEMVERARSVGQ